MRRLFEYLRNPADHIEWFVAGVGLVFGLLFLVLLPPMQGPDESNQFLRVYQISQGNIVSDYVGHSQGGIATSLQTFDHNVGGNLPSGIVDFTFDAFGRIPQHSDAKTTRADLHRLAQYRTGHNTKAAAFGNTAAYSPIAYLPQVFAVLVGRLFQATPLVLMYLIRLASLVAGVALVALAVRLMPFGKLPLAVVALLPMTVGQLSVISADGMTIAVAFLAVAVVLRYAFQGQAIQHKEMVLICGLFALLGFIKPSLLPLGFIGLLLLCNPRIGRRTTLLVTVASVMATAVCALAWNALVKDQVILGFHMSYPSNNYAAQLSFILHEPWRYVRVLGNTFFTSNLNYVPTSFIGYFGWADTPLPLFAVVAGFMLVGFSFLISVQWEKVRLPAWGRWLLLGAFVGVALLTATYMYLFCDAPRDPFIVGIQGRYFTPAMALLPPIFFSGRRLLKVDVYRAYARRCLYASVALLFVMTCVVASRYYSVPALL